MLKSKKEKETINLVENLGIAYRHKKNSRKEYKCKILGRQVSED